MEYMLRVTVMVGQADAGVEQEILLNCQVGVHNVVLQASQRQSQAC